MLPTNEKATSSLVIQKCIKELSDVKIGELRITPRMMHSEEYFQEQHLYITSDDEIKEGNWYISADKKISQLISGFTLPESKKIIATTDSSLTIGEEDSWKNRKDILYPNILPQPSQSFIEKYVEEYNKGNVITDVLVEYEGFECSNGHLMGFQTTCSYPHCHQYNYPKLKINPKDNTITIKKVKDSWSKEEHLVNINNCVDFICEQFDYNRRQSIRKLKDKWIEENL